MAERREAAAVDSDDAINVGGAVLAVLGINSAWGIRVGGGPSVWLLLNSPVLLSVVRMSMPGHCLPHK